MDKYNKWINQYIENVDLSNIQWLCLNSDELSEFYQSNYLDFDEWQYVIDDDKTNYYSSPLGLHYLRLDYNKEDYKFLIGVVNNNINKKTIVAAMIYLDNYYIFDNQQEPFTYVSSIEVNSFFWRRGIFKKLCFNAIKFININQNILLSDESMMGRKYRVIEKFRKILVDCGFEKMIVVDDFNNYSKLYDLICYNNKKLKKIK